jgi:hypothetical protein
VNCNRQRALRIFAYASRIRVQAERFDIFHNISDKVPETLSECSMMEACVRDATIALAEATGISPQAGDFIGEVEMIRGVHFG